MTMPEESAPVNNLKHRRRRFCLASSTCIAFLAVLLGVFLRLEASSRRLVFGKTDPSSGYRIEYTLSSYYDRKDYLNSSRGVLDEVKIEHNRSSILDRLRNLFIKPNLSTLAPRPYVLQISFQMPKTGMSLDPDGYPLIYSPIGIRQTQRKIRVCGVPALRTDTDMSGTFGGKNVHCIAVSIYGAEPNMLYVFQATCEVPGNREDEQIRREMDKIVESVKIVNTRK